MTIDIDDRRTSLIVLGGFLGAGKTTLLNHLLSQSRGRTAVLVNDFGAVNIDASLVADHDGRTLRLTNGCVCCSLADGFLETLMRVLTEPFDRIVIEASGVANPWNIAEIALIEPGLWLGAVIVLADAERLPALVSDTRVGDVVRQQIEAADIVVLNKVDLVDTGALARAQTVLISVKPGVRFIEAVSAEIPLELFDTEIDVRGSTRRATAERHESTFHRVLYRRAVPLDTSRLAAALATLPSALLRLKGMIALGPEAKPHLLQMVGTRFELSPAPSRPGSTWPVELVGIGSADLDVDAIERILDSALIA